MKQYVRLPSRLGTFTHLVHRGFLYALCGVKVDSRREELEGGGYTCMRCIGWRDRLDEHARLADRAQLSKAAERSLGKKLKLMQKGAA